MPKFRVTVELDVPSKNSAFESLAGQGYRVIKTARVNGVRKSQNWAVYYKNQLVRSGYKNKKKAEQAAAADWEWFCGGRSGDRAHYTVTRFRDDDL